MDKNSSKLAFILFSLLLLAGIQLLTLGGVSLFLRQSMASQGWVLISLSVAAILHALIFHRRTIPQLLKMVLSLAAYILALGGGKYIQVLAMERPLSALPNNTALLLFTGLLWAVTLLFNWMIRSPYERLASLLEEEKNFTSLESYGTYIRETLAGRGHKGFSLRNASRLLNLGLLLLLLSILALILSPGLKTVLSIALVGYGLSALGIHLLIYKMEQVLDWKLSGISIPAGLPRNWDRLILLLLTLALAGGLALPWYFQVFNLDTLNRNVQERLTGLNITISPDQGSIRAQEDQSVQVQSTNTVLEYTLSRIDILHWKGVTPDRETVLSNIKSLQFALTTPSLTRQVYRVERFGPDILISDDLKREDALSVLSSNRVLARIEEKGQLSLELVIEKLSGTQITEISLDEDPGAETRLAVIRAVLWSLAGAGTLYLLMGLAGGLLLLKYRYARRPPWVSFLIRVYEKVKIIINVFFFFFRLLARFFMAMLGLRRIQNKPKEDLANPVAQQLFSLFSQKENMSDEKKEEVMTIIREFVRLIDVASRLVVPYRYYYGPQEYIRKVISFVPGLNSILEKIVETFNESRYSLHILGESRLKNFSGTVKYAIDEISKLDTGIKSQSEREADQKAT